MKTLIAATLVIALAGCAGRNPNSEDLFQLSDSAKSCKDLAIEIAYNNDKVKKLANEKNWKLAQNVAAGAAGIFVPVLWFGMDFKGAASQDMQALQFRQKHLADLVYIKDCGSLKP